MVQDTASYQKLIEWPSVPSGWTHLKASIDDMKAGKLIPADDVLAEMRQILDGKQGPLTYRVVFTARARADAVRQFQAHPTKAYRVSCIARIFSLRTRGPGTRRLDASSS